MTACPIMSDSSCRSGREKAWATTRMASSGIDREHLYASLLPIAAHRVLLLPARELALTRLLLRPDSPPSTASHRRNPGHHLFRPAMVGFYSRGITQRRKQQRHHIHSCEIEFRSHSKSSVGCSVSIPPVMHFAVSCCPSGRGAQCTLLVH
ncbi:hypothetical protein ACLOJK_012088 [Asimina triloba]